MYLEGSEIASVDNLFASGVVGYVIQLGSEIQLEHEKEYELVMVAVKVVHEYCMMVVKEIEDELLEEIEKFRWWFEQDIGGKSEDDREKRLVMLFQLTLTLPDEHLIVEFEGLYFQRDRCSSVDFHEEGLEEL
ncbi:hypothetical protein Tco_0045583 [Tanacetum coccineum]